MKKGPGRKEACVPKDVFPHFLSKLLEKIEVNKSENIKAGFRKCGIVPLNPEEVLLMLPDGSEEARECEVAMDSSFVAILDLLRYGDSSMLRRNRKKLHIEPGKSVSIPEDSSDEVDEPECSAQHIRPNPGGSCAASMESEGEEENENSLTGATTAVQKDHPISRNNVEEGDWVLVSFPCDSTKATSSKERDW